MRIVILGATGQVGSVIHEHLSSQHDTIGTSRKKKAGYTKFDPFTDDWSVLPSADVLINCIGQIDSTDSSSFYDIHIQLIHQILRNRSLLGNPRIVQISALGASSRHRVAFLQTKGYGDDLLLREQDTVILRPSIICTSGTMIVKKLILLQRIARHTFGKVPIPSGFLQRKIQPIMPVDLVHVVETVCTGVHAKVLNLVGPETFTFEQLLTLLFPNAKNKVEFIRIPRLIMDFAVTFLVAPLFPKLISRQQYMLLFEDNIADTNAIECLLKRPLTQTRTFFINEFAHARY